MNKPEIIIVHQIICLCIFQAGQIPTFPVFRYLINQSINQSNNQSINHSINQPINQSTNPLN